jgi:putative endonuclease
MKLVIAIVPGRSAARSDALQTPGPRLLLMVLPHQKFYVYILASRYRGTLYVGFTNDLSRRMTVHKDALTPGFTKKYKVRILVYYEEFDSVLEARARERVVKRWRREWKIRLIEGINPRWRDLTPDLIAL